MIAGETIPVPCRTTARVRAPLVLLAEDDRDLRALFGAGIRRAGYDVQALGDGREAIDYFTRAAQKAAPIPELIVMDIRMPYHSGLELLIALRLAEWHMPVILTTGFGDRTMHLRAQEFGAQALLDKPVSTRALVQTINTLYQAPKVQTHSTTVGDAADSVLTFDKASSDRGRGYA